MCVCDGCVCRMLLEGRGAIKANYVEAFMLLQKVSFADLMVWLLALLVPHLV